MANTHMHTQIEEIQNYMLRRFVDDMQTKQIRTGIYYQKGEPNQVYNAQSTNY